MLYETSGQCGKPSDTGLLLEAHQPACPARRPRTVLCSALAPLPLGLLTHFLVHCSDLSNDKGFLFCESTETKDGPVGAVTRQSAHSSQS